MTHVIPAGTSEPQEFRLRNEGVAIDGTDITVGIEVFDCHGTAVSGLTVEWKTPLTDGIVQVTGIEDLAVGTYTVRFTLEDDGGLIGKVPTSKRPDTWEVVQ